jgi:hypothetical protein
VHGVNLFFGRGTVAIPILAGFDSFMGGYIRRCFLLCRSPGMPHAKHKKFSILHKKLDSTAVSNVIKNGKKLARNAKNPCFRDTWFAISFHEPIQKKM